MAGREATTVGDDTTRLNQTRRGNSKGSVKNISTADVKDINLNSKKIILKEDLRQKPGLKTKGRNVHAIYRSMGNIKLPRAENKS